MNLSRLHSSVSSYHKAKTKNPLKSNPILGSNPGFPRKNLTDLGTKTMALHVLRSAIKEQDSAFVESFWCEFWCDLARIDTDFFRERYPLLINFRF